MKHALNRFDKLLEQIGSRKIALFLDFDGTLSELVADPAKAEMLPEFRPILEKANQQGILSLVSGRGIDDLKEKAKIKDAYYVGCHGFEMTGPDGLDYKVEGSEEVLPELQSINSELSEVLGKIPGVIMEPKKYAIAIHYRNASEDTQQPIETAIIEALKTRGSLRIQGGKKLYEVRPKLRWNKGLAVLKLMEILKLGPETFPIFMGDDVTDEDAFEAVQGLGVGIKVGDNGIPETHATYRLYSVREVVSFLSSLGDMRVSTE